MPHVPKQSAHQIRIQMASVAMHVYLYVCVLLSWFVWVSLFVRFFTSAPQCSSVCMPVCIVCIVCLVGIACIVMYVLYCIVIVLYCIVSYRIVSYRIVSYCIVSSRIGRTDGADGRTGGRTGGRTHGKQILCLHRAQVQLSLIHI